jgi:hypothetical protein
MRMGFILGLEVKGSPWEMLLDALIEGPFILKNLIPTKFDDYLLIKREAVQKSSNTVERKT